MTNVAFISYYSGQQNKRAGLRGSGFSHRLWYKQANAYRRDRTRSSTNNFDIAWSSKLLASQARKAIAIFNRFLGCRGPNAEFLGSITHFTSLAMENHITDSILVGLNYRILSGIKSDG